MPQVTVVPTAFIMLYECYMTMHKVRQFWPLKIIPRYEYHPEISYSVLQNYIYFLKASKFLTFGGRADLQSQVLELRNASIEDACAILMLLLPSCVGCPYVLECSFPPLFFFWWVFMFVCLGFFFPMLVYCICNEQ